MRISTFLIIAVLALVSLPVGAALSAPQDRGIDPEALIDQILSVDAHQRAEVKDLILDAEYVEGKLGTDGDLVDTRRFLKEIYIQYLPDTTRYHERYLEYYKDGQLQPEEELQKEARDQAGKRRKRGTRTIAYPILTPFRPEVSAEYSREYAGVTDEKINGRVCHHFRVMAKVADPDHINGDYYFDAESFHLVRVDFTPAKLPGGVMSRLNQLTMSIQYEPTPEGYWFPVQCDMQGKGKAAFFFGINFAAVEYYSNPRVNTGLQADIFEENDE